MAKAGPRKIANYGDRFKATAVKLSSLPGVQVKDTNVSPAIQQRFAASYQAAGGTMQLELLPEAPHNFVNMPGPILTVRSA
ncbi:MAG TPA: hypothetical protein VE085_10540 [Burkholderiales bacterium]|nr:hypothetical protein [Burkholderiales bacterium]